ncbi:heat shock 70 kDa protein 12A-like isoform X1 [Astatotilapia calliptera]|uniref:Heat shock protein family A (Hsp70) member 12A.2 n=1 Tax=Astatotilapia calliptera TaxID=8154 RepID=A0A3P8QBV9_ASTCA|nr:heat shock 70 kDa protein 12A-like isoform X1 [Astatotilapia calliptera]
MANSYIIAIDFGTAYSGYAFSLTKREAETEPRLKYWGEQVALKTPKTPTCILFDEHENFLSFGYEAQSAYFKTRSDESRKKFFFECFKMSLYGKKLNSDVTIEAANGRSMKALKVFTEALRYLKEDALKFISEDSGGKQFIASDFTWVVTVPAIWDPSAKQFMREAATQAGIVTAGKEDRLVIALEPEAASVWCKKLPADGFKTENNSRVTFEQASGTQYIVVDCGGGTIDITVHEVLEGGALKELHKASGNDLGGQTVDKKFKEFLREIFSDSLWDAYEKEHPAELQKMMYEISVLKENDDDVEISCPYNLAEMAKEKQKMEKFFESLRGVSWNQGAIKISKQKVRSFFAESLNGITKSLREILKKDFRIEYILLVGGYARSLILRQHITNQFGGQYKVLCPSHPQEAIMKGAVLFGRNPALVASRISAFTYGVSLCHRFDESKHKADKRYTNKEGEWCDSIFCILVKENEEVGWDKTSEYSCTPIERDQTAITFAFYRTERKIQGLIYVDEWGVEKIGSIILESPDTARGMNREIKLQIKFGATEMTATAIDVDSGSTVKIDLDFMAKSIKSFRNNVWQK